MNKYYLTFGQKYPWRDGWVEVIATDLNEARQKVIKIFDRNWSALYSEENFDKSSFPDGQLGRTII